MSDDPTSLHIARAHDGDAASRAWLVTRFSPLLRLQACYRLRGDLRRLCDPDELVDEVWLATLPRFGDLRPRDGHWQPVLLKFLGTTLLNKVNSLLMRHLRERARRAERPGEESAGDGLSLDRLPSPWTSVVSRAARDEAGRIVRAVLDELGPEEREILVLRGVEQLPNREIAQRLGLAESATTMRYRRALRKLEGRLPRQLLDELPGT